MKKVYCPDAGEMIDDDEMHEGCVCKNCEHCGFSLRGKGYSMIAYNNLYLHKKCIIEYLVMNDELESFKQLKEE